MLGVQRLGPVALRPGVGHRAAESGRPPGRQAERDAWVVLMSVPGLGPVAFAALLRAFGSGVGVLAAAASPGAGIRLWEAAADGGEPSAQGTSDPPLSRELACRIRDRAADAEAALGLVRRLGLEVVTLDDDAYPRRLRAIELPPPVLFVRGAANPLAAAHTTAVVGTRRPSDRGRLVAAWIASALARAGSVVVSGLAVGIDGAAHAAVVAEGLPTVAVLGGGHARLFPKAHERLADAIVAAGGAVVAELAPETPATRGTFPRRNRIVSGLSDASVVVEAGVHSGALITAGWALEQGRDCFLVPGPIDSPTSAGCNAFLRGFPGQTRVVCGIPELIEDLGIVAPAGPAEEATARVAGRGPGGRPGPTAPPAGRPAALAALGPVERALAEHLATGSTTADELASRTSLTGATILSALTLLELRGLVTSAYGRYSPAGALACWSPPGPSRGQGNERSTAGKSGERA